MKFLKKLGKGWLVYVGVTSYFYYVSDTLCTLAIVDTNKNRGPGNKITIEPVGVGFVWKSILQKFKTFYKIISEES